MKPTDKHKVDFDLLTKDINTARLTVHDDPNRACAMLADIAVDVSFLKNQAEELSALHARIEEGDKALDLCVMFLTNTNTINEDKQAELVKHLRESGRVDLADAIAMGGFAALVGDE